MNNILLLFAFFGGLILFLGIGYLIGNILNLDKWQDCNQKTAIRIDML